MTLREKIEALKLEEVLETDYGDKIYSVCKSLAYPGQYEFWQSYHDYGMWWESEIIAVRDTIDSLLWEMSKNSGAMVMRLCEMTVVEKPVLDYEYRKEAAKLMDDI